LLPTIYFVVKNYYLFVKLNNIKYNNFKNKRYKNKNNIFKLFIDQCCLYFQHNILAFYLFLNIEITILVIIIFYKKLHFITQLFI